MGSGQLKAYQVFESTSTLEMFCRSLGIDSKDLLALRDVFTFGKKEVVIAEKECRLHEEALSSCSDPFDITRKHSGLAVTLFARQPVWGYTFYEVSRPPRPDSADESVPCMVPSRRTNWDSEPIRDFHLAEYCKDHQ